MKFETEEELLKYTSKIKGKTFKDIDSENLLKAPISKQQKLLYNVITTGFYKNSINKNNPNFEDLSIGLKVSGYVKNPNGTIDAKERLILREINYNEIIFENFEYNNLFGNCKKILIIWYEYDPNKQIKDFIITNYQLYELYQDKIILENDFEIIKGKIFDGKAHELSEGDTSYLGAYTNSTELSDKIEQPFSNILTNPKVFSLKKTFLTGILRELKKQPTLITITPEYKTVEEYVLDKLKPYLGKTQIEIYEELFGDINIEKIPKNINKKISDKIIGKDKELPFKHELFLKTNFIIKNIPIKEDGTARERMSFKTLRLSDFEEPWENSFWKSYFEETTLIVICYEEKNKSKNGYRILKSVKKISFDDEDLNSFKKTYNQLKLAIELRDINLLPTPNSFENQMLEIAPKGVKGDNAYVNFFKNDKTKVSFMINKKLLNKKLEEL